MDQTTTRLLEHLKAAKKNLPKAKVWLDNVQKEAHFSIDGFPIAGGGSVAETVGVSDTWHMTHDIRVSKTHGHTDACPCKIV